MHRYHTHDVVQMNTNVQVCFMISMRASVRYPSLDQLASHETSKFTIRYNTFTLHMNTASQADMHRKSLARPAAQVETHVEIDFD